MHTCMHAYIHTYMHACMHTPARIHTYMHTYRFTHTRTHTHTYKHICTVVEPRGIAFERNDRLGLLEFRPPWLASCRVRVDIRVLWVFVVHQKLRVENDDEDLHRDECRDLIRLQCQHHLGERDRKRL